MKITIETIPHKEQRYPTVGDWTYEDGNINIKVSEELLLFSQYLVAMHELTEVMLCIRHGISGKQVDEWDMGHPELDEPGNDPRAPYYREHLAAEVLERSLASYLEINWWVHERDVDNLMGQEAK